jgi:hypothetical protein
MLDKIKLFFMRNVHIVDVLFSALWIYSYFHNGESVIKLEIDKLNIFYATVRAYVTTERINDSVNNTVKGEMPK